MNIEFFKKLYKSTDTIELRLIPNIKNKSIINKFIEVDNTDDWIEDIYDIISKYNKDYNCYFGVNPREGQSTKRITKVRTLFVDIDSKDFKDKAEYEKHLKNLNKILEDLNLKPSAIVNSGNGKHYYWFLNHSISVNNVSNIDFKSSNVELKQECKKFTELENALIYLCKADKQVKDLPRILRIPGSKNVKEKNNPKNCEIETLNDIYYNLQDFNPVLNSYKNYIKKQEKKTRIEKDYRDNFKNAIIETLKNFGRGLFDNYSDFLSLCLAFKSAGYGYSDIDPIIQGSRGYNYEKNKAIYTNLKPKNDITFATAYYYAYECNRKFLKEKIRETKKEQKEDRYTDSNDKKITFSIVDQLTQLGIEYYAESSGNFYKVDENLCKISVGTYEVIRRQLKADLLVLLKKNDYDFEKTKENKILNEFADDYINEINSTFNQIHGLVMRKNTKDRVIEGYRGRKFLNVFFGFGIEYDSSYKIDKEHLFKENKIYKLLDVLMGGNETYKEYILKLFAYNIFSDHKRRLGKALVLHSRNQRIGKGQLMQFFKEIFPDNYKEIKQKQLDSNFNEYDSNSIINVFDEVKLNKEAYEELKFRTTAEELPINIKGVREFYRVNNIFNVYVSNNENPIPIPKTDERCIMIKCEEDLKDNFKWFMAYRDELKENSKELFHYLKKIYDEEGEDNLFEYLQKTLKTSFKKEVIAMNLNSVEEFFSEIYEDDELLFEVTNNCMDGRENIITLQNMYKVYCEFCDKNKRQPFKKISFLKIFTANIQDKFGNDLKRVVRDKLGKTHKCYDLNRMVEEITNDREKIDEFNIEDKIQECADLYRDLNNIQANKLYENIMHYFIENDLVDRGNAFTEYIDGVRLNKAV